MDDYAGQAGGCSPTATACRCRPPTRTNWPRSRGLDTASGQEVLVRQVPLPEVVDAEVSTTATRVAPARGAAASEARSAGPRAGPRTRPCGGRSRRRWPPPGCPTTRGSTRSSTSSSRATGCGSSASCCPRRPLAALLADQPLSAHRAAEIAADLLTALRVVHAHGWTHRNVTARTVLICDDGRALLTGLAVGAAQEALCGYDPLPDAGPVPLPPSGAIPGDRRAAGRRRSPAAGIRGCAGRLAW